MWYFVDPNIVLAGINTLRGEIIQVSLICQCSHNICMNEESCGHMREKLLKQNAYVSINILIENRRSYNTGCFCVVYCRKDFESLAHKICKKVKIHNQLYN